MAEKEKHRLFKLQSQLANIYLKWHGACILANLLQSCPTLCNPVDHSLPCSSVQGIPLRQEYWRGCPCLPSGDFSGPGIEVPRLFMSPALASRFFTMSTTWVAPVAWYPFLNCHIKMVFLLCTFLNLLLPHGQHFPKSTV